MKNLLKPTKAKIIVDLLFILILLALFLFIPSLGYQKQFLNAELLKQILGIIISALFGLVIYYPFACGLVFIYRKIAKKEEKRGKKDLALAILFVLLFNPIAYALIIQGVMYVNRDVINYPCGIEITGFAETSPAKNTNMAAGEIIINIDNNKIDTLDSFFHVMADKKPGDSVSLTTNAGNYNVKTIENPNNPSNSFMGIMVNQKYCQR